MSDNKKNQKLFFKAIDCLTYQLKSKPYVSNYQDIASHPNLLIRVPYSK